MPAAIHSDFLSKTAVQNLLPAAVLCPRMTATDYSDAGAVGGAAVCKMAEFFSA